MFYWGSSYTVEESLPESAPVSNAPETFTMREIPQSVSVSEIPESASKSSTSLNIWTMSPTPVFAPVHEPIPSVPVKPASESTPIMKPVPALKFNYNSISVPESAYTYEPAPEFGPNLETIKTKELLFTTAQRRRHRKKKWPSAIQPLTTTQCLFRSLKKSLELAPAPDHSLVMTPAPKHCSEMATILEFSSIPEFSHESAPAQEFCNVSTPISEFYMSRYDQGGHFPVFCLPKYDHGGCLRVFYTY